MYPELFKIGSVSISSFSVMVLIGFLVAYKFGEIELERKGLNGNLADILLLACVIGGLGGAKLLFLYQQATFADFMASPSRYLASGFTFFGGLIGALVLMWAVANYKRINFLIITDAAAPALIIAYAIGRIGCLLVGDDYGVPTDLPWGISFPDGAPPTLDAVHPTQVYDTIIMTLVFIFLWKIRKNARPVGWLTAITLIILGVQRFLIEFIRSTTPSFIPGISQAQVISTLLVIAGCVILLLVRSGRLQPKTAGAPSGS